MQRACPTCGLIQWQPTLGQGLMASCARCFRRLPDLERAAGRNQFAAALATAAAILFPAAIALPFLRIERLGHATERSLVGGVIDLWEHGQTLIAGVIVLFSLILPPTKLLLIITLAFGVRRFHASHRAMLHTVVEQTGRWGMLDVLLVAVLIALVKLGDLVAFEPGPGLFVFVGFVLTSLAAGMVFDPHAIWETGDSVPAPPTPTPVSATDASDHKPHRPIEPMTSRSTPPQSSPSDPVPTDPVGTDPVPATPVPTTQIPTARVGRPRRWWVLAWIVPLIVAGVTLWAVREHYASLGPEIEIRFQDAHGLKPGDALIHRGTTVGQVQSVQLDERLTGVVVKVRLDEAAAGVAVEGSRFWIVRPRLDVAAVSGLETVVGAKYLEVLVGPERAERASSFLGLDEPPVSDLFEPGGREVILTSAEPRGLRPGSPVFYRSIRIGGVTRVGLAGDGAVGEIRAYIRPGYTSLIREGTRFWMVGGVRVSAGVVGGFSLDVGPLETLLHGGIAIAVPEQSREPAPTGRRFTLHAAPEPEWLTWSPQVLLDTTLPTFPQVRRAKQSWTTTRFFLSGEKSRPGWATPLQAWPGESTEPGDTLMIVPADLLVVDPSADGGRAKLTLGEGPSMTLAAVDPEPTPWSGATEGLSLQRLRSAEPDADAAPAAPQSPESGVPLPFPGQSDRPILTADRIRQPDKPEEVWLTAGGDRSPLMVSAGWLELSPRGGWTILPDYARSRELTDYHGVPAMAAADGKVVGWLIATETDRRIVTAVKP